MDKNYQQKVTDLEGIRQRLSSGKLSKEDISELDQLIVGHIELNKSIVNANERVGDKVVIAKLPFGVDLVK
jgi:hypothetical protein